MVQLFYGLLVVGIGFLLLLLILVIIRIVPRESGTQTPDPIPPLTLPELHPISDAIFVVGTGGRILYANDQASKWFGYNPGFLNLERIAQRIHPSDAFLGLCSTESGTVLTLDGRLIEAYSYRVPFLGTNGGKERQSSAPAILVSLREPESARFSSDPDQVSQQTLDIFSGLAHKITSNLELEPAIHNILESVEQITSADVLELTIWDRISDHLIPYRLAGLPGEKYLEKSLPRPKSGSEFSEFLIGEQKPLLLPGENDTLQPEFSVTTGSPSPASFLGVPIVSGDTVLGTLELTSKYPNNFDANILFLLTHMAEHAAVAISNAYRFSELRRKYAEFSVLEDITSVVNEVSEVKNLFSPFVSLIGQLIGVEILGFLIYREQNQVLEAQVPFQGIPDQLIDLYRVVIPSGSAAEELVFQHDKIVAPDAAHDEALKTLGLDGMAVASGIQSTVLVPLRTPSRFLGYIQAADRLDGQPFDQEDFRILESISKQVSTAIENALLVDQTEDQSRRIELLQKISKLMDSSQAFDEVLSNTLHELISYLSVDFGLLFMLDEATGDLKLHTPSAIDLDEKLKTMPILREHVSRSVTSTMETKWISNIELEGDLPDFYQKIFARLAGQSGLVLPLIIANRGVGELHLISRRTNDYEWTEMPLITAVTNHLANRIEKEYLYTQTDENLRHEVDQLTEVNRINRDLSIPVEVDRLLEAFYEKVMKLSGADCGVIVLHKASPNTWEMPTILYQVGSDVVHDFTAIELDALRTSEAYIVQEYQNSQPNSLDTVPVPPHPGIRSSLVIPFAFQEKVSGFIHLHSRVQDRFDETLQDHLMKIAVQAAISINNALLHRKLQNDLDVLDRRVKTVSTLLETSKSFQPGQGLPDRMDQLQDRDEILKVFANQVLTHMEMDVVLVSEMADGGPKLLHQVGDIPPGVNLHALLGQKNPLRTCFLTGKRLVTTDLEVDEEWKSSPILNVLAAKAFICQPVLHNIQEQPAIKNEILDCVLLAVSRKLLVQFDSKEEELLTLLSRQVTVALHNARLNLETNRRLQELNLLVKFSQQIGELDFHGILKALLENVLQVIPAAAAGFLALWSEEQEMLVPQVAMGYSNNQKILQISLQHQSALVRQAFHEGHPYNLSEVNFTVDYEFDSDQLLCYRDATQGKLPVSTLVIPLSAAEAHIGVLILENYQTVAAFNRRDQALILALTHQTALTLQNARLYQASEARAVQLQALMDVTNTITSSLQSEDLINTILIQARSVVPFDSGTLWLRQGDQMTVRAANGFAQIEERVGLSVALEDSVLLREMAQHNEPITVNDVRSDDRFPDMMEHQFLSWLGVPLQSKAELIGVIVLEKTESGFYSSSHVQAMVTFSGQVSVALENAYLYEDSLQRTRELRERSARLTMLNRLSTALSGSMDVKRILGIMTDEMLQELPGSSVSVALLDSYGELALHHQAPSQIVQSLMKLPAAPTLDHLKQSLGVFSTEDASQELGLEPLINFLAQMDTRALMIVPLVSGNNLSGFTFIHSQKTYRFSPDEISLALTISNQVAAAIENARLFEETEWLMKETQQRSLELAALFDLGVRFTQELDQNRLLEITFENLNRLIEPDAVAVAIAESDEQLIMYVFDHGERKEPYQIQRQEEGLIENVIRMKSPLLVKDLQSGSAIVDGKTVGERIRCWLGVPLVVRGQVKGVLSIQSDQPDKFGVSQENRLSQIANQLSVALDNANLFQTVQSYTRELEQRVLDRTEQLEREHRRIQTLLSITTELSASLDLDTVLNRTLGILVDTLEAERSSIFLIQKESPYLTLRASLDHEGVESQGDQSTQPAREDSLEGWVINNRQAVLVEDLFADKRWEARSDHATQQHSAIVAPLLVGEEVLGVVTVVHPKPAIFNQDQLDLVQAVAKQIAIAINNTHLYSLIRDQAERLGTMLRAQHVDSSRSQAILEAVADGVLVTDSSRTITLFNPSAEKILGLSRTEILGHSLEHFTGLFGKAAQSWVRVIRNWSEHPDAINTGDIYEAELELENHQVVSVHLSPVQLYRDFLGTVSIFRDITHQIEVDRLKSEFIATVSHELRTPMTSIKGYVEILLMGAAGSLNAQQNHFLEIVKGNTERLAVLVNDLLDLSRMETGKVNLSLQPVDMRMVADEVIDMVKRRMASENHSIEIEKQVHQTLPLIQGDPDRIRQIMRNLLENSYQYTPSGGHIKVTIKPEEKNVRVDIRDDGIGIKPEEADRVFERFYRGDDPLVLASSGTGLGLSIVQSLVQMHQGRIWFESEGIPGRGSVFSFTIPVYTSSDQPDLVSGRESDKIAQAIEPDNGNKG